MAEKHINIHVRHDISSDIGIVQCGTQRCSPGHSYGPAVRHHYLIHYIVSGKGTFNNEYGEYQLCGDDLFMITPGELSVYTADSQQPWEYIWIGFSGEKAASLIEETSLSRRKPVIRDCGCEKYFRGMTEASQDVTIRTAGYVNSLRVTGELMRAFSHLTSLYSRTASQRYTFSENVMAFIKGNIGNDISISQLAADFGYTRTYFSALFKKQTGMSPVEYLLDCRMEAARDMLSNTRIKIGYVARSVGYADALLFSRQFKTKTGLSPTQARQAAQQEKALLTEEPK